MNERAFNVDDRCGDYRIVRFLGRGRSAEVYEAVHMETGRAAALRRARVDRASDERLKRRLLDEASALARAEHANVVAVLDTGVHEGAAFAALEHVAGASLRERLGALGGTASLPVALCFIKQVADAASALHAAGAAHGDLRAETVRVTALDEVKLCDLGPEAVFTSPTQADIRRDIASVGLLLGEMLLGRPLSAASLESELAQAPLLVRDLIQRSVVADREGGFTSMTELSAALDDAWSRFMEGARSERGGLRRALDALATALQALPKARAQDGDAHEGAELSGDDEDEESERTDLEALMKSVVDATHALDPDDEGTDGPPTDRDP